MSSSEACPGCGLQIAGGSAGCQALFDELLARSFGDAAYFPAHRLLVDTYALQHPDAYCTSAISLAAHLTGVCVAMEYLERAVLNARVQRWLSTRPALEKPPLPGARGAVTVAEVCGAGDFHAHAEALDHWARATWSAYAELHALARDWIRQSI